MLRGQGHKGPINASKAVEVTLRANGGDRRSEHFQSDNCNTERIEQQGNNTDYLTARIARDRPDILDGMKEGAC